MFFCVICDGKLFLCCQSHWKQVFIQQENSQNFFHYLFKCHYSLTKQTTSIIPTSWTHNCWLLTMVINQVLSIIILMLANQLLWLVMYFVVHVSTYQIFESCNFSLVTSTTNPMWIGYFPVFATLVIVHKCYVVKLPPFSCFNSCFDSFSSLWYLGQLWLFGTSIFKSLSQLIFLMLPVLLSLSAQAPPSPLSAIFDWNS